MASMIAELQKLVTPELLSEVLARGRNGRHHPDGGREQCREHDSY
jgi:hypothetical protein